MPLYKKKFKTIFITRVAGMIGSHLLDVLINKGYKVFGIDNFTYGSFENIKHHLSNPNFQFVDGDVMEAALVSKLTLEFDAIIHVAAVKKISEKESSMPTMLVNTKGTENMLQAAM